MTAVHYDATNPTSGTTGADRSVGYTYDAVGNRTQVNDSVNGNASYTANSDNQYTNVAGSAYGYDGNGNLGTGNGLYFYDAQNRLNYAQVGSNIDQFSYDSKNRVVKRTVNGTATYFVYDGWDLIEERNGSGTVLATYVHGVRQDEMLTRTASGTTIYYHHNALGSVTDLTNASGAVVEKYKYDAFGKPAITDGSGNPLTASAYGNRFLFTGREFLAEVNLYDYRNRVYSSDLGRFLQTDPIRFNAGDVNIYRYCGNNPLNLTDSMGENPSIGSVAGGATGVWAGGTVGAELGGIAGAALGGIVGAVAGGLTMGPIGLIAGGIGGMEVGGDLGAGAGAVGGAFIGGWAGEYDGDMATRTITGEGNPPPPQSPTTPNAAPPYNPNDPSAPIPPGTTPPPPAPTGPIQPMLTPPGTLHPYDDSDPNSDGLSDMGTCPGSANWAGGDSYSGGYV